MLHLLEVTNPYNLDFLTKLFLAESPTIPRPLMDVTTTTNTNETEQDITVANGNECFFRFVG